MRTYADVRAPPATYASSVATGAGQSVQRVDLDPVDLIGGVREPPMGDLPPGPRSPGVAQTLLWMYRPISFMERCRRRYGSVFSLRLGPGRNTVVIADPDAARRVVRGDPQVFRAGDANGILTPVVGPSSLLVLDGEEHMRDRRVMLPTFGAEHGRVFADEVERITRERVGRW